MHKRGTKTLKEELIELGYDPDKMTIEDVKKLLAETRKKRRKKDKIIEAIERLIKPNGSK